MRGRQMIITWAKVWVGGVCSFHIAACLLTPVGPGRCPQDFAYLEPIHNPPPYGWLASLCPSAQNLTHVLAEETDQAAPQRATKQHLCMYDCLHTHTHVCAELQIFLRDWESGCTQRITQGDPGFTDV